MIKERKMRKTVQKERKEAIKLSECKTEKQFREKIKKVSTVN